MYKESSERHLTNEYLSAGARQKLPCINILLCINLHSTPLFFYFQTSLPDL